jgi:hypothetical protein
MVVGDLDQWNCRVLLVKAIPGIGVAVIIAFVLALLAAWWARWYLKRPNINKMWLRVLFWSNVVTWLVPAVGFFTGFATLTINEKNHGSGRTKYMVMAVVGLVLSFANSLYGAYLHSR